MALYVFQGVAKSGYFAPLALEGEGKIPPPPAPTFDRREANPIS